jgi:hypothetical protein
MLAVGGGGMAEEALSAAHSARLLLRSATDALTIELPEQQQ